MTLMTNARRVSAVKAALGGMVASVKAAPRQPTMLDQIRAKTDRLRYELPYPLGPRKYLRDSQGRANMADILQKPVEQYWERPPLYWKERERVGRTPGLETDSQIAGWESGWTRRNAGRRWSGPPPANWRR